jgi:hypothetical protein
LLVNRTARYWYAAVHRRPTDYEPRTTDHSQHDKSK